MMNIEHYFVRDEEAGGSNPLTPTIYLFDLDRFSNLHKSTYSRTFLPITTGTKRDSAHQSVQNPCSDLRDFSCANHPSFARAL